MYAIREKAFREIRDLLDGAETTTPESSALKTYEMTSLKGGREKALT